MAIIYSYPIVVATLTDLVLGSDISGAGNPTKNFTVQSLIDLIAGGVNGLGAVIEANSSALDAAGIHVRMMQNPAVKFDIIFRISTEITVKTIIYAFEVYKNIENTSNLHQMYTKPLKIL